MATDLQSLFALSRCYECFAPNSYTLDLMQAALLAKWSGLVAGATFQIFTTPNVTQGNTLTVAHGLGQVPPIVMPVLVCVANDANTGYVVGDEVPLISISSGGGQGIETPCGVWVDATNVYLHTGFLSAGNENFVLMWVRSGNTTSPIQSVNNWNLKVYCIVPTNGQSFTAPDQANNTGAGSFAHGLSGTPNLIFPAFRGTANDAGFATGAGMEGNIVLFFQNAGGGCAMACRAGSSNLVTDTAMFFAGNEANFDGWAVSQFNVTNPASLNNFIMRPRVFLVANSFLQTLNQNSGAFAFNHGFNKTPQLVYCSLACIANDPNPGFIIGDEIPIWQVTANLGIQVIVNVAANATQIFGHTALFQAGVEFNTQIWQRKTGAVIPTSLNDFQLKIYAWAI